MLLNSNQKKVSRFYTVYSTSVTELGTMTTV